MTFARSYALLAATQDVSNILWYEVKNLRSTSAAIGDVNNYHLGGLSMRTSSPNTCGLPSPPLSSCSRSRLP